VAEQGCLLSSYPDKIGIGGSNPPLSAIIQNKKLSRVVTFCGYIFSLFAANGY
jgi:hypothetical protein